MEGYHGGDQEVRSLEGLRLVAAVAVVWFHCQLVGAAIRGSGPPGTWYVRTGYFAVDALFVLSGFAQFLPFAARSRRADWRGYAVRRFARIVPAYWVAIAATTIYIGHFRFGPGKSGHWVGIWELLIHLTFLNHLVYGISGQQGFGINTAMWTLTGEAIFYVTLPFIARPFLRHPFVGLMTALGVSVWWRLMALWIAGSSTPSVYIISQVPAFAFQFALGMAAAIVVVRCRAWARGLTPEVARRWQWGAAGGLAYGVAALVAWQRAADPAGHGYSLTWGYYTRWVWNLAPASAFALIVVCVSLAPKWAEWPLSNPVVRWFGEATYGIYLSHILLMLIIARWWRGLGRAPLPLWQIALVTTMAAVLVGRLSFLLVEEPSRRVGRSVAMRLSAGRRPQLARAPRAVGSAAAQPSRS